MSLRTNVARIAIVSALSLASTLALASGSDAIGRAQTGDAADYNLGKRVFAVKVACDECSMPGLDLNRDSAMKLLEEAPEGLTARERKALNVYLNRRFNH